MSTRRTADLAALVIVLVWGVNFPLLKLAMGGFGLSSFTFLRFAGMLALAWGVLLVRPAGGIERGDWPRIAASGLLGYTLYIGGSLAGVYYSTAFSTALLIAAAPAFAALLLQAGGQEELGASRWLGLAISFLGVALFVGGLGRSTLIGNLINAVAAFCYAAYNVVNRPLVTRYPGRVLTAWTLSAGAVPLLALTAPALGHQDWSRVTALDWVVLAWTTVVPVYVAWTVWHWIQARIGINRPAALLYLVPLVAGVVSWALLGEGFSWTKAFAAAVILAGVVLARGVSLPGRLRPEPAST